MCRTFLDVVKLDYGVILILCLGVGTLVNVIQSRGHRCLVQIGSGILKIGKAYESRSLVKNMERKIWTKN
jgi:hypothetical protein